MNLPVHFHVAQYSRRKRRCWFMGVLWTAIGVKCVLVWWASAHWQLAYHPLWVVVPTLVFAFLVTAIWLTHRPD